MNPASTQSILRRNSCRSLCFMCRAMHQSSGADRGTMLATSRQPDADAGSVTIRSVFPPGGVGAHHSGVQEDPPAVLTPAGHALFSVYLVSDLPAAPSADDHDTGCAIKHRITLVALDTQGHAEAGSLAAVSSAHRAQSSAANGAAIFAYESRQNGVESMRLEARLEGWHDTTTRGCLRLAVRL